MLRQLVWCGLALGIVAASPSAAWANVTVLPQSAPQGASEIELCPGLRTAVAFLAVALEERTHVRPKFFSAEFSAADACIATAIPAMRAKTRGDLAVRVTAGRRMHVERRTRGRRIPFEEDFSRDYSLATDETQTEPSVSSPSKNGTF